MDTSKMLNGKYEKLANEFNKIQECYNKLINSMNEIISSSENLQKLFHYKNNEDRSEFNFLNIPIKLELRNKINEGIVVINMGLVNFKSHKGIIKYEKKGIKQVCKRYAHFRA